MKTIEPQKLLAVGIDTAARSHHAVAIRFPEQLLLDQEVKNTWPSFEELDQRLQNLAQEHGLTLIYGLEGSGSFGRSLADFLLAQGRDVREVQPVKVNRHKAFYGQDKSDQIDARTVAAVVLRCADDLPQVPRRDETLEAIRKTSRFLDQLVKEQTRNLNQLHAALLETYQAHAKTLFLDLDSNTALEFYLAYPAPRFLAGLSTTRLANLIARASRGKLGSGKCSPAWNKAHEILEQTRPLVEAPPSPGLELQAEIIQCLGQRILNSKTMIKKLTRSLEKELLPKTGMKLSSAIGISARAEGIILGETRNPDRFSGNDAYARYNGTAPASHSTGGRQKHRARRDCNHRLKRIFHLVALVNSQHDPLGKAYYESCITRGLDHNQALKRLARRISDLVYAMMRDKSAYDPAVVLASMERRNLVTNKKGGVARTNPGSDKEKRLAPPVDNSTTTEANC